MMQREHKAEGGFGLLEAIIALAIASLALAALYRGQSIAVRGSSRAQAHYAALESVRAQMDAVGNDGTVRSGRMAGRYSNGLSWRLNVSPLTKVEARAVERPYWVVLEAFDRDGFLLVRLETAKIAREAE